MCLNTAMDAIAHFSRLFAYDGWANQETLRGLRATGTPVPTALKLMAHIFAAQRVWLERLEQKPQSLPVWPELTLEASESQASQLPGLWKGYLAGCNEADLSTAITYQNSKGEAWSSRKQDILMHVINHSTYHRGQVAAAVRAAGFTPATTDFIFSIRQGLVA